MTVEEYNTWRGVNRTQATMPYIHQEYPKMLYHSGGRSMVVENAVAHKKFRDQGWRDSPNDLVTR